MSFFFFLYLICWAVGMCTSAAGKWAKRTSCAHIHQLVVAAVVGNYKVVIHNERQLTTGFYIQDTIGYIVGGTVYAWRRDSLCV